MSKSLASYLTTSVEIPKRLGSGFILVCSFFGELMTTGGLWTSTEGKRAPILPGDDPGLKYPGDPTDALSLKYIFKKFKSLDSSWGFFTLRNTRGSFFNSEDKDHFYVNSTYICIFSNFSKVREFLTNYSHFKPSPPKLNFSQSQLTHLVNLLLTQHFKNKPSNDK